MYDLIVIGGGASGIFASIIAKEKKPALKVLVIEKGKDLLLKVKISGGGRCNLTNATFDLKTLASNYPRGQKEVLAAFYRFSPKDTIDWFESKKIVLKTEEGGRVFPKSDSSQTIIDCFLQQSSQLGVEIVKGISVESVKKNDKDGFLIESDKQTFQTKNLLLATGSSSEGFQYAKSLGHTIVQPIPSLFGLNIKSFQLKTLSGVAVSSTDVKIKGFKNSVKGPLLITHFGFSGPAVLNLSSFAARYLFENKYQAKLYVNWLADLSLKEIDRRLLTLKSNFPQKTLVSENLFKLPKSLWEKFLALLKIDQKRLSEISKKDLSSLALKLHSDSYLIEGKTTNKQEFVTCGGVNLKEVNFQTMESKLCPHLYFAGEILDIDGITGGFNFQNAWTTAYIAAANVSSLSF